MKGEAIFMLVADVGAELDLARIPKVLGAPTATARLTREAAPYPKYDAFPQPLEATIDPTRYGVGDDTVRIEVRLHAIGGAVVRVRVPYDLPSVEGVIRMHAERTMAGKTLEGLAETVLADLRAEITPALRYRYDVLVEPETYWVTTVISGAPFTIGGKTEASDEVRITRGRPDVAALIEGEANPKRLARETVDHALRHVIRYLDDDAVVIGWERAVVVDPDGRYEDVLDIMELANLELVEFRTYDAYLDQHLGVAFATLDKLYARDGFFQSARGALHELSEVRLEFARLTDNLYDTRKLFGDWYLAKLHQHMRDRFHLQDWEKAVDGKMETLKDMFTMAGEEAKDRRGLVLEVAIVLLVLSDFVLYALGFVF